MPKEAVLEIIHACIDSKNYHAAIMLIEIVQKMDLKGRDMVLIEFR